MYLKVFVRVIPDVCIVVTVPFEVANNILGLGSRGSELASFEGYLSYFVEEYYEDQGLHNLNGRLNIMCVIHEDIEILECIIILGDIDPFKTLQYLEHWNSSICSDVLKNYAKRSDKLCQNSVSVKAKVFTEKQKAPLLNPSSKSKVFIRNLRSPK